MKKLKETITLSSFTTNYGIFTKYQTAYPSLHTWLTSSNAHTLDIEYYLSHSGDKLVSIFYENLEELVEAQESGNVLALLADAIALNFGSKWNNIYKALESNNYDPLTNYNESSTRTPNLTNTTNTNQTGNVYGYNSATAVPAQNVTSSGTNTATGTETIIKSGLGGKTKQELMNEEVEARKHIIWNIMMNDVDSLMCNCVYCNLD